MANHFEWLKNKYIAFCNWQCELYQYNLNLFHHASKSVFVALANEYLPRWFVCARTHTHTRTQQDRFIDRTFCYISQATNAQVDFLYLTRKRHIIKFYANKMNQSSCERGKTELNGSKTKKKKTNALWLGTANENHAACIRQTKRRRRRKKRAPTVEWTKRAAKEIWENKCKWNNDYEFEDASAVASGADKISRAFSSTRRNFSQYVFSGCAGFS